MMFCSKSSIGSTRTGSNSIVNFFPDLSLVAAFFFVANDLALFFFDEAVFVAFCDADFLLADFFLAIAHHKHSETHDDVLPLRIEIEKIQRANLAADKIAVLTKQEVIRIPTCLTLNRLPG